MQARLGVCEGVVMLRIGHRPDEAKGSPGISRRVAGEIETVEVTRACEPLPVLQANSFKVCLLRRRLRSVDQRF